MTVAQIRETGPVKVTRQYHLLWDINGERAYESVYLEDGNTVTEHVWVNSDGSIGLVERIVFGAEDLQRCLEKQQADLTWMQTGERVGPYALALEEPKIIPDQGPDSDPVRDEAPPTVVQSEDVPPVPVTPNLEPPPLDPEVEQAAKGIAKRIHVLGRINIDYVYRDLMPRTGLVFIKAVLVMP